MKRISVLLLGAALGIGFPAIASAKPLCKHITAAVQTCSQAGVACGGRCNRAACHAECEQSLRVCMSTGGHWSTPICNSPRRLRVAGTMIPLGFID
jgi:hypothetical protein